MAQNQKCASCGVTMTADTIPANCTACGAPTSTVVTTPADYPSPAPPAVLIPGPVTIAPVPAAETAPPAPISAPTGHDLRQALAGASEASAPVVTPSPAPADALPPAAAPAPAPVAAAPVSTGTDWSKIGSLVLEILTIGGAVLPTVLTGGAAADVKLGAALLRIAEAAITAHRQVATEPVDYSKLGQEAAI